MATGFRYGRLTGDIVIQAPRNDEHCRVELLSSERLMSRKKKTKREYAIHRIIFLLANKYPYRFGSSRGLELEKSIIEDLKAC